ncbi:MAG: hydrogenase assembly protein HupF [Crenarchaeota archaeon]|nr:hydrogenase assembly protein HupF [Thermoproteota archaeon]
MGGKARPELLKGLVFEHLGAKPYRLILGPSIGEDAAAIDFGEEKLVLHTDPITGARELAGWLAIHVPCNDVAATGADPLWVSVALLIPSSGGEKCLESVVRSLDEAARSIGVAIVSGHTEFVDYIESPILVSTCMGLAKRIVATSGARPGDVVIVTKSVALEGTAILATDFEEELLKRGVSRDLIASAREFYKRVSVVEEARVLRDFATSMHDPTEGGIVGGLLEVAAASRARIVVYEDRIPISRETEAICSAMGVDPLRLISSGCLIATVPRALADKAIDMLRRRGIEAAIIGEVAEGMGVEIVKKSGERVYITEWVEDELYRLLSSR